MLFPYFETYSPLLAAKILIFFSAAPLLSHHNLMNKQWNINAAHFSSSFFRYKPFSFNSKIFIFLNNQVHYQQRHRIY